MTAPRETPLLILDLDGTVRHGREELGRFVNTPADVVVFPEAVRLMRAWKRNGGRILGATNQGAVALRLLSPVAVTETIEETIRQTEELFDLVAFCPHHPEAVHPRDARCWCRKPAPGLVIDGAHELARRFGEYYPAYLGLFVGDMDTDRQCARILSIDFQLARDWRASAPPETDEDRARGYVGPRAAPSCPAALAPRPTPPVRPARLRDRKRP